MFKYGNISEVKSGYAKVSFQEDDIVSDWLPVIVRKTKTDKESWPLEINEHVVCLVDEYCNDGVILGAIVSDTDSPDSGESAGKFRKLFSDGTLLEYDKNAHKLTVNVQGSLEATTTGAAKIDAGTTLDANAATKATVTAPDIALTGNVVITGTATISGALAAASISTVPGGGGDGSMNITGDISLSGKIAATGELSGSDVKAGAISLLTHKHTGVTTGGGISGTPV